MSIKGLGLRELEANIEVGLLTVVFDLHPEHASVADLIGRARAIDPHTDEEAAIERALKRLRDAELLQEIDGRIAPTKAALHFDQLPF